MTKVTLIVLILLLVFSAAAYGSSRYFFRDARHDQAPGQFWVQQVRISRSPDVIIRCIVFENSTGTGLSCNWP
jgi:hypothetical protein